MEPDTGGCITAYLSVAAMPYSQMIYVEATTSMNEKAWLSCHVNIFQFFGGTPVKIVCNNLKTGVTSHPKRGEIILNEAYLSLGEDYSVFEYIWIFYNRKRIHEANGYLAPEEYYRQHRTDWKAA